MIPRPPTSTLFPYTTLFRSEPFLTTLRGSAAYTIPKIDVLIAATMRSQPGIALGIVAAISTSILGIVYRSEEHTSELQSRFDLVCRLLLEKKKKKIKSNQDL